VIHWWFTNGESLNLGFIVSMKHGISTKLGHSEISAYAHAAYLKF
jgi:hypothetical protein